MTFTVTDEERLREMTLGQRDVERRRRGGTGDQTS
jgi:hypothetical protein